MDYEQFNEKLPTIFWKSRMDEGDDIFTKDNILASEKALINYIKGLKLLKNPTEEEILERVKKVVLEFNQLNEEFDYFIETMEREELYEFIDGVARAAGLDTDDDITEEWREW